ncbi:MAG: TolC family protein [Magnetococcales bacterium]|nr:TolC family protein [Magnetococcales bacterium]
MGLRRPKYLRLSSRWPLILPALAMTACTVAVDPLTDRQMAAILDADRSVVSGMRSALPEKIGLYDAMARALTHNLDYRVKLLERAVAIDELDLSRYELLPKIAANAGLSFRDRYEGSSSLSIASGERTEEFSASADILKRTSDVGLVWNVLDFGASYFQARQDADRILIAEENRRRIIHTLIQEVRWHFWMAASVQSLEQMVAPVIQAAQSALSDARNIERELLQPPLQILRFQRALVDVIRRMKDIQHEMVLSKSRLASLINLPPGTNYVLEIPEDAFQSVPELSLSIEEMEEIALTRRPELRELVYSGRITANETRKAMVRMLPGLEFNYSLKMDSNSFLQHAMWEEAGLRVTWNLLNIVTIPQKLRHARDQKTVARVRRLAMHMTVLSQVHLAYRRFENARRQVTDAREVLRLDNGIKRLTTVGAQLDAKSQFEQIRASADAVISTMRMYQTFSDLHNSLGQLYVSLGVDPFPEAVSQEGMPALTKALQERALRIRAGLAGSGKIKNDFLPDPSRERMFARLRQEAFDTPVPSESTVTVEGETVSSSLSLDGDKAVDDVSITALEDSNAKLEHSRTQVDALPPPSPVSAPAADAALVNTRHPGKMHERAEEEALLVNNGGVAEDFFSETDPLFPLQHETELPLAALTVEQARKTVPPVTVSPELLQWLGIEPGTLLPHHRIESAAISSDQAQEQHSRGSSSFNGYTPGIQSLLEGWSDAWSKRDLSQYLSYYHSDFQSADERMRPLWMADVKELFRKSGAIQVSISDPLVQRLTPDHRLVSFQQKFLSDHFRDHVVKILLLERSGTQWKILAEKGSKAERIDFERQARSEFAIQVASCQTAKCADRALRQWQKYGYDPYLVSWTDQAGRRWRMVRVGRVPGRNLGQIVRWSLTRRHRRSLAVVPYFWRSEERSSQPPVHSTAEDLLHWMGRIIPDQATRQESQHLLHYGQLPVDAQQNPPLQEQESDQHVLPVLDQKRAISHTIRNWAATWSRQDLESHLSFYATTFEPLDRLGLTQWRESKRLLMLRPRHLLVEVDELIVTPLDRETVMARFIQTIRSDDLQERFEKTLIFGKESGLWKILLEASSPPLTASRETVPVTHDGIALNEQSQQDHTVIAAAEYAIQFQTCLRSACAIEAKRALESDGLSPYVMRVHGENGQAWFSIRMGRFFSRSLAELVARRLAHRLNTQNVVVSFDGL